MRSVLTNVRLTMDMTGAEDSDWEYEYDENETEVINFPNKPYEPELT